jgi:hypothetical protein
MSTATMTQAPAQAAAAGKGNPAPVASRPFRIGVQSTDEHVYDVTVTTTAAQQDLTAYALNSSGFLTDIYVWVVGTTAANAATVTFAARGPFNALASIEFDDVNNKPVVGPFDGWELSQIDKLGGYLFSDDPKSSPTFSATTGAGGTGGSFEFIVRLPIQIVPRDALGALPNKSNTSTYKVKTRLNATANIYGTAPTSAPSVRVRLVVGAGPGGPQGSALRPAAPGGHHNPVLGAERLQHQPGRDLPELRRGWVPDPEPDLRHRGQHRFPVRG